MRTRVVSIELVAYAATLALLALTVGLYNPTMDEMHPEIRGPLLLDAALLLVAGFVPDLRRPVARLPGWVPMSFVPAALVLLWSGLGHPTAPADPRVGK